MKVAHRRPFSVSTSTFISTSRTGVNNLMANDTFQAPKEPETKTEPEQIKIGEKAYSQDDLSRLVGLGELADEIQTKQNRDLDKIWPAYNEDHKELIQLRDEMKNLKDFQTRVTGGSEPQPEDLKEQARKQLKELGAITNDDIGQMIEERVLATLQGKALLEEIESLNKVATSDGKPKVDPKDLLDYMEQTGFKSPTKAYKDKFENELRDWETKKVSELKPQGFSTQETSTAGSKTPAGDTPTGRDALYARLGNFLKTETGSENA